MVGIPQNHCLHRRERSGEKEMSMFVHRCECEPVILYWSWVSMKPSRTVLLACWWKFAPGSSIKTISVQGAYPWSIISNSPRMLACLWPQEVQLVQAPWSLNLNSCHWFRDTNDHWHSIATTAKICGGQWQDKHFKGFGESTGFRMCFDEGLKATKTCMPCVASWFGVQI